MEIYTEQIIDLAKNPLNKHESESATHTKSGVNLTCGDHLRIYLSVNSDGTIAKASWQGEGCAISIASASILTEELAGKTTDYLKSLSVQDILDFLEIPSLGPARIKCASLCLETAQGAVK